MTAQEIIKTAYNGHANAVTPDVMSYTKLGENSAAELSRGEILWERVYGVSVVINGKPDTDKSISFDSLRHAEAYIETLKKGGEQNESLC